MALPAVLACLALCLGAVQAATQQTRMVEAAAQSARLLARGDDPAAAAGLATKVQLDVQREGGMVCVNATSASAVTGLGALGLRVSARACALEE